MADLLSLFTSKIGFLGCIALPSILLAAFILKSSVGSIQQELNAILEMEKLKNETDLEETEPVVSEEEYNEMYERIKAELIEELTHVEEVQLGSGEDSEDSETE